MAQTNESVKLWAESGARAKYAIHNGMPHIGVSGDEGDGYIVPLPAPGWFHNIPDEGTRDNVFRALASHALRVGQAKLKQADTPSRDVATSAVASALNGGYKPSREVTNDITDDEVTRLFKERVTSVVKARHPNATDAQIEATIAKQAETDAGKALMTKLRGEVLERGTYAVSRKGKTKTEAALDIALGE